MSIPNISRVNTIDEWRIQTNDSANALNTLETGAYEKTTGSLTVKNDASLVITSTGTALQVSNAAQFSTNVSIGKDLFLGARETATGNLTVGKEVIVYGSGNALTVANNATVNNNLQVTKTITTNNITVNTNVSVTGTTQSGSLIIDTGATVGTTLGVTGNTTSGNLTTTGATDTGRLQVTNGATVGATLVVTGNVTGGNLTTAGAMDTGRLQVTNGATIGTSASIGTTLDVTGNVTGGNLTTAGVVQAAIGRVTTTLDVTGNVTGGNLTTSNVIQAGTGRISTTLDVTGNATAGNLVTSNVIQAGTGRITTTLDVTGNATAGNLVTSNVIQAGIGRISTTLDVTGNVTGGNLTTSNVIQAGTGRITTLTVTSNTTTGNLNTSGVVNSEILRVVSGATVGTTLTVTGNTTVGNLNTSGVANSETLRVNSSGTVGTTLTVTGNTIVGNLNTSGVANSETLRVNSSGTIGTTLTVTGNTTVGNLNTSGVTNSEILRVVSGATIGTTLAVTGNISGGNLTTSNVIQAGTGRITTTLDVTGNITGGNLTTSNVIQAGTGRITTTLDVTGNITGGNLTTSNVIQAGIGRITTLDVTSNATVGNLNTSGVVNSEILRVVSGATVGTTLTVTGNTTAGNLITSNVIQAGTGRISTTLDVTGNTTAGNLVTSNVIQAGTGRITTLDVTGNTTSGNLTTTGATDTGRLQVTNGATIGTTLAVTGNISGGNLTTSNVVQAGTGRFSSLETSGAVTATSTTDASSSSSGGALTVSGGAAVAKKLYVGSDASVTGTLGVTGATSLTSATLTGSMSIGGDLQVTGSTIYIGPTLNDTNTVILRGQTRQTKDTGYDYFAVNRSQLPVTLNVITNTVNTSVSHALSNGQNVVFSSIVGTTNITSGLTYRVLNFAGSQAFFLTTNYGAGNTVVDLTGVNGTATITDSDSYDAHIRWDETNKIWDIRNTTDGTYSKILLRSDLSDSLTSTSSTTPATSAAANSLNTKIRDLNTSQVAENTGYLYLTAARVRANVSASAPINYNSTSGAFGHDTSGVTASGYGDSISIPVFAVNSTGHVTSVTNTTVRSASTSQTGVVQLTDSVSSTSTTTAATPNSVKTTYDAIGTANSALKSYSDNKFAPLAGAAFTGDVSVQGNLTVTGTTTYMNTNTLNIGDNIITLNADLPSNMAATENAGIEVNRGANTNVYVRWDESIDAWVANNGISGNEYRLANSTTYLSEGTNLYYTDARARGAVSASGSISYNSGTGVFSYSQGNTDTVSEGTTNKYYTDTRARGAVSGTAPISYNSTTGAFSHDTSGVTASGYGSSTNVPVFVVDAKGHITGVTNTAIAFPGEADTLQTVTSRGASSDKPITLSNTNTSTSNSTGALMVAGGAGFKGNVWADALYDNGTRVVASVSGTAPISASRSGTSYTITHDTSGVTATTYANSTFVPVITVDAKGHVTSITNTAISFPAFPAEADTLQTVTTRGASSDKPITLSNTNTSTSNSTGALMVSGGAGIKGNVWADSVYDNGTRVIVSVSGTAPISASRSGTSYTITHDTSGVTATTYGNTTNVPVFTVNDKGHITSVTNTAIAFPAEADTLQTVTGRSGGATTDQAISITNTTTTTSNATGALKVSGGAGFKGNVWADALYDLGTRVATGVTATSPISVSQTGTSFGVSHATSGVTAASYGSATVVPVITVNATGHVTGVTSTSISFPAEADTLSTVTGRGATTSQAISLTGATASTSTTTGTLKVTGGVGITGNIYSGAVTANTGSSTLPLDSIVYDTSALGGFALRLQNKGTNSSNVYMGFLPYDGGLAAAYVGLMAGKFTISTLDYFSTGNPIMQVDSAIQNTTFWTNIRTTGTVTAGYSDDRLKDKQGNIPNALEKVSAINGFYYTANQTAKDLGMKDGVQIGVSSQEVEKVLPEVVVPSALDGYNTVQYEKLVPLLIEAIKELKAEVDELKKNK